MTILYLWLRRECISEAFSSLIFLPDRNVNLLGCSHSPAKKQRLNTRRPVREWTVQVCLPKGKLPARAGEGIWVSTSLRNSLWLTGRRGETGCCYLPLLMLPGAEVLCFCDSSALQFALLPGRTTGLQSQLLLRAVVPEEGFAAASVHS